MPEKIAEPCAATLCVRFVPNNFKATLWTNLTAAMAPPSRAEFSVSVEFEMFPWPSIKSAPPSNALLPLTVESDIEILQLVPQKTNPPRPSALLPVAAKSSRVRRA